MSAMTSFVGAPVCARPSSRAGRRAALATPRAAATSPSLLKTLERKKLLSAIESSGLLSKLSRAGLSLEKVEDLKLLSTAENLGALSLAEGLLTTSPSSYIPASIPFFVLAAACIILPDGDVSALQVVGATLATVVGLVFVGTGFAVANLQSED